MTVAENGDPIFLIRGLAEHTKNLERDPRASLLVAEGGSADPLANGRVTTPDGARALKKTAAARAPRSWLLIRTSTYYADFRDFAFWKLHVDYVRYIGYAGCRGSAKPRLAGGRTHLLVPRPR